MIGEEQFRNVVAKQRKLEESREAGLERSVALNEATLGTHALIVSGVRRCGKSTLMTQRMRRKGEKWLYLKFDAPQLVDLELADMSVLDGIIEETGAHSLYFDEMPELKGWELYVLQKLDEGFRVCVTGSNASLLKGERATKLTGRHLSIELMPFSYEEYLRFVKARRGVASTKAYLADGGFPRYLATKDQRLLIELFDDIMYRDVIVRNAVREVAAMKRLAAQLVENPGCRFSATKVAKTLGVSGAATVLQWCDWLEDAYLFFFMPKYCDSVRAQQVNPRKVYCVDTGLLNAVSRRVVFNDALVFENLVYLALRRRWHDLYYYDEGGECDFIAVERHAPVCAVQATVALTDGDRERELRGLGSAMDRFGFKEGWIVTLDARGEVREKKRVVHIVTFNEFSKMISTGVVMGAMSN